MPLSKSTPRLSVQRTAALSRLRRISHLLDNAVQIPGVEYRVGIDPLIGLLPGGGDLITGFIAVYIIAESTRMGVPAATLGRMGLNVLIDVLSGTIPMIGDLFDVAWKSNSKNVALLEQHLENPRPSGLADKIFAFVLITVLLAVVLTIASVSFLIVRWVLSLGN